MVQRQFEKDGSKYMVDRDKKPLGWMNPDGVHVIGGVRNRETQFVLEQLRRHVPTDEQAVFERRVCLKITLVYTLCLLIEQTHVGRLTVHILERQFQQCETLLVGVGFGVPNFKIAHEGYLSRSTIERRCGWFGCSE